MSNTEIIAAIRRELPGFFSRVWMEHWIALLRIPRLAAQLEMSAEERWLLVDQLMAEQEIEVRQP